MDTLEDTLSVLLSTLFTLALMFLLRKPSERMRKRIGKTLPGKVWRIIAPIVATLLLVYIILLK